MPVMLAAFYGLRRSEALGVRWSNIDFRAKTISISHKVVETNIGGKYQPQGFDRMKNISSNCMLPLIPEVETELLKQQERQKHYSKALGLAYDNSFNDYVCTDELGKLLSPNYLSRTFGKLLKQNGLRHIRYHDLRHINPPFSQNSQVTLLRQYIPLQKTADVSPALTSAIYFYIRFYLLL